MFLDSGRQTEEKPLIIQDKKRTEKAKKLFAVWVKNIAAGLFKKSMAGKLVQKYVRSIGFNPAWIRKQGSRKKLGTCPY